MCTIIRYISSYIKGLLFLAVMVLNLGTHQVRADIIDVEKIIYPDNPFKITSAKDMADVFESINYWMEMGQYFDDDVFSISLEADIDMGGVDFVPVLFDDVLIVNFEGNGHTITMRSIYIFITNYSSFLKTKENKQNRKLRIQRNDRS